MRELIKIACFSVLITSLLSVKGFAFTETARHGYLSCSTCHYSPSGRGLLTPYGKTMANELFSYWKSTNDSEALETETPWWRVGGQVRALQLIQDSDTVQKGRFFPMQAELEGAIDKESWLVVASAGAWRPLETSDKKLRFYSRNHYVLLKPHENWSLRLGHFRLSHGLGLPDHTTLTNQGLGWTHSHETYNVELSYLDENHVVQATWIAPSKLLVTDEVTYGGSINFQRLLLSSHKVGFNVTRLTRAGTDEAQLNLHTVINIGEVSFIQAELAQRTIFSSPTINQHAMFTRYSHQLPFGLRPLLQHESGVLDKNFEVKAERFYVGTEWFPTPTFDLLMLLGEERQSGLENQRVFNVIGHFYF